MTANVFVAGSKFHEKNRQHQLNAQTLIRLSSTQTLIIMNPS